MIGTPIGAAPIGADKAIDGFAPKAGDQFVRNIEPVLERVRVTQPILDE
jgi:hypothetical protein